MWTCFVAEYACISVVTELDDSFRSGIFSLVSSFQRDVLHAPCSFSDNQCLQWHEMWCHCWCQSYCGLEASTSCLCECAWCCFCLPESQELLPCSQQHTVNPWGVNCCKLQSRVSISSRADLFWRWWDNLLFHRTRFPLQCCLQFKK